MNDYILVLDFVIRVNECGHVSQLKKAKGSYWLEKKVTSLIIFFPYFRKLVFILSLNDCGLSDFTDVSVHYQHALHKNDNCGGQRPDVGRMEGGVYKAAAPFTLVVISRHQCLSVCLSGARHGSIRL